jgi:hypothetical protein
MPTNREVWDIEEQLELRRTNDGKYVMWWAGCEMTDPKETLEEIVESPILEKCVEALKTPCHRTLEHVEIDSVLGDSIGFDLEGPQMEVLLGALDNFVDTDSESQPNPEQHEPDQAEIR